jgi:hypothetical protein
VPVADGVVPGDAEHRATIAELADAEKIDQVLDALP